MAKLTAEEYKALPNNKRLLLQDNKPQSADKSKKSVQFVGTKATYEQLVASEPTRYEVLGVYEGAKSMKRAEPSKAKNVEKPVVVENKGGLKDGEEKK